MATPAVAAAAEGCRGDECRASPSLSLSSSSLFSSSLPTANAQQQQRPPSPPPPPSEQAPRHKRSVAVRDAGTFRAALDDGSVSEILLGDAAGGSDAAANDIDLEGSEAFPAEGPPAVIGPGRTLFIRSADGAVPASLNFTGGPTPAIVVARDAALVFSQVLLSAGKPPSAAAASGPDGGGVAKSFAAPELGMWPSISLEPGSEVRRGERERRERREREKREREERERGESS